MGSPTSAATFASSTRFAPLAMTSIGNPDVVLNTSDFAICPTEQPNTAAASIDVLAGTSYSTIVVTIPAVFNASWTRCADVDSGFDAVIQISRYVGAAVSARKNEIDITTT